MFWKEPFTMISNIVYKGRSRILVNVFVLLSELQIMSIIVYGIPLDRIEIILYDRLNNSRSEMIIIVYFLYLSYSTISIYVVSM